MEGCGVVVAPTGLDGEVDGEVGRLEDQFNDASHDVDDDGVLVVANHLVVDGAEVFGLDFLGDGECVHNCNVCLCVNRLMMQSYDVMYGENSTFEGRGIDLSYF